jgi:hypothetical protein
VRPRVALTLSDARVASIASAIASEAGAVAQHWDGDGSPDADLWIVSGAAALPERTAAFIGERGRRRALVLGDGPVGTSPPAGADAPRGSDGEREQRIVYAGRQLNIATIRQAIHDSVRHLRRSDLQTSL